MLIQVLAEQIMDYYPCKVADRDDLGRVRIRQVVGWEERAWLSLLGGYIAEDTGSARMECVERRREDKGPAR
jgi:hypothetical protein